MIVSEPSEIIAGKSTVVGGDALLALEKYVPSVSMLSWESLA